MKSAFRSHQPFLSIIALAALGLTLQSCDNRGPEQPPSTTSTVKIAANLPLTGDLATYGASVRDGANLAVEALAKSDPNAPKLRFDWQDNAGDPKQAVTTMQEQLIDEPDIYVSGVKPQTMAIKDQISAKGVPHFVWIFDAFINSGTTNNFRTWVSYKIEPPMYLDYAKKRGAKRVAVVYVQLPHTIEEFNSLVLPGLKSQGVADTFVEPFEFGKKDFKDVALKVKTFKPDLIILNGFQAELVSLVRALRPLDLIKDGNTIATYDMLDAATILGKDELEGIRVVTPIFVSEPDRDKVKSFKAEYSAKYGKEPLYTHAFAYDMASLIADAAKRVKSPATHQDWIAALKATAIEGVTGPLKFDNDGDLVTPLEVAVFRGGAAVPDK